MIIEKKELKKNLAPKINFYKPKELEQLAKLFKGKFKNIDLEKFISFVDNGKIIKGSKEIKEDILMKYL